MTITLPKRHLLGSVDPRDVVAALEEAINAPQLSRTERDAVIAAAIHVMGVLEVPATLNDFSNV